MRMVISRFVLIVLLFWQEQCYSQDNSLTMESKFNYSTYQLEIKLINSGTKTVHIEEPLLPGEYLLDHNIYDMWMEMEMIGLMLNPINIIERAYTINDIFFPFDEISILPGKEFVSYIDVSRKFIHFKQHNINHDIIVLWKLDYNYIPYNQRDWNILFINKTEKTPYKSILFSCGIILVLLFVYFVVRKNRFSNWLKAKSARHY